MKVQAEADREFWRAVLVTGGFSAIPRWTLDPATGTAEHEAKIPDDLVAALRRLADELACRSVRCCWLRTPRYSPRCPANAMSRPAMSAGMAANRCSAG